MAKYEVYYEVAEETDKTEVKYFRTYQAALDFYTALREQGNEVVQIYKNNICLAWEIAR